MTIKEIIQKLHTTMTDARGQESHFESWMTLNEGICDAIDALKALDKQEPVAWMSKDADIVYTSIEVDGYFQHDHIPLYTTPPQRKPLTDEQIYMNCPNWLSQDQCKTWVRQIEAAHGIKDKNKRGQE